MQDQKPSMQFSSRTHRLTFNKVQLGWKTNDKSGCARNSWSKKKAAARTCSCSTTGRWVLRNWCAIPGTYRQARAQPAAIPLEREFKFSASRRFFSLPVQRFPSWHRKCTLSGIPRAPIERFKHPLQHLHFLFLLFTVFHLLLTFTIPNGLFSLFFS